MAVSVKKVELWRREVGNQPGTLARTLEPLARSGANLKVLMGYGIPGDPGRAVIELFPISGAKGTAAARQAGLSSSPIATLLVEGDNRAGLGHSFASAVGEAGINIDFIVAQVIGNRFSAVMGFPNNADADRAAGLIKRAGAAPKRRATARRKKTK